MPNQFYTNNFKGRAGRRERAKHLVEEFQAIEDAFTKLQAYNINTTLSVHTHIIQQSGTVTIRPDNGYLQEIYLTENITFKLADPLNEKQYRVSVLVHGANYTVTNGWGAQTWKEYGNAQDNWWELFTGSGPYASMLLDFWWDICTKTWICVASSKNPYNSLGGRISTEYLYPLLCNLTDTTGTDTWGYNRAGNGQALDQHQHYHYLGTNLPRYHGVRWVENWCPTASDLTSVAWVDTDCTVTTVVGAGPNGEDVQQLEFDLTGGKLGSFILPSFGRATTDNDPIKVAVSFKARSDVDGASMRVVNSLCGKIGLTPPVHDAKQVSVTTDWKTYGFIFNILKDGNDTKSLALDQFYPKTLMEIAFVSPSGSTGDPILVTDVQIEVLRYLDEENVSPELQETTIGTSIPLIGIGTGSWDDGAKTLTLATEGQSIDFGSSLEAGKTYLVDARLQNGDAADIRMQRSITFWASGTAGSALYVESAPFTFQYDGGELTFVLTDGVSSVYLIDVYEVSNDRSAYCYQNTSLIRPPTVSPSYEVTGIDTPLPYDSGVLLGTAREVQSENLIPYAFFRSFVAWDQQGLAGVTAAECRNPVFQSEFGIDGRPSRATLLQGASRANEGYITRDFAITPSTEGYDIQMWVRRTFDSEGNVIYTPQYGDVTTEASRFIDFEAELLGGASTIESGRIRVDLQAVTISGLPSGYNYTLGVYVLNDWLFCNISLQNDGTHDTFRFRVYPASGDTPDASVVKEDLTGWVVIDWMQFEVTGGTFVASSPIIGGETRNTDDFTTALPDGNIYATFDDNSLYEVNKLVATAVSGDIVWEWDDYVHKNLLFTTDGMGSTTGYNMHEFGLVEDNIEPPQNELQILTTTPYPIYAADAVTPSLVVAGSAMREIETDDVPTPTMSALAGGGIVTKLLVGPTLEDDVPTPTMMPLSGGGIVTKLLVGPTLEDDVPTPTMSALGGSLDGKLVTANAPEEAVDSTLTLNPSGCSLDQV